MLAKNARFAQTLQTVRDCVDTIDPDCILYDSDPVDKQELQALGELIDEANDLVDMGQKYAEMQKEKRRMRICDICEKAGSDIHEVRVLADLSETRIHLTPRGDGIYLCEKHKEELVALLLCVTAEFSKSNAKQSKALLGRMMCKKKS